MSVHRDCLVAFSVALVSPCMLSISSAFRVYRQRQDAGVDKLYPVNRKTIVLVVDDVHHVR
jgi:hypothetical protein